MIFWRFFKVTAAWTTPSPWSITRKQIKKLTFIREQSVSPVKSKAYSLLSDIFTVIEHDTPFVKIRLNRNWQKYRIKGRRYFVEFFRQILSSLFAGTLIANDFIISYVLGILITRVTYIFSPCTLFTFDVISNFVQHCNLCL